jgi:hypothetical protein
VVEIRLITYKRPKLLERALASLIAQTHPRWRAVVHDDSASFESEAVVQSFKDPRIVSRKNERNLGMILNLGQAFAAQPVFPESTHACILEDDNAFDPTWLEYNLEAMRRTSCAVMVRNYRVVDVLENGDMVKNPSEPMRDLYGDASRELPYAERVREAFFNFTLGTCSYFWDLRRQVDLSLPSERLHGPVMEAGRAVCFAEACWYEPEPLSDFSRFVSKRQTPRSETPASAHLRRVAKISEIRFTRSLVNIWTKNLGRSLPELLATAAKRPDGAECIQRLAEAGCWSAVLRLRSSRALLSSLKAQMVAMKYEKDWLAIHATC